MSLLVNSRLGGRANGFRLAANRHQLTSPREGNTREIVLAMGNGQQGVLACSKTNALEYDRWQHLSVNVDATVNRCAFYVDGRNVTGQDAGLLPEFNTRGPVYLGAPTGGTDADFREVRIYSRTLNEKEIRKLAAPRADY